MRQGSSNEAKGHIKSRVRRIAALLCLLMAFPCLTIAHTGLAESANTDNDLFYAEDRTGIDVWDDAPETGSGSDDWYNKPSISSLRESRLADLHEYNQAMSRYFLKVASLMGEDADSRAVYILYGELLSKPMPGRPSEAESRALSEKLLSDISSQLEPPAVVYYKECVEAEPKITSDLCDIAEAIGTEMFGLEYRLKSAGDNENGVCRIADKIAEYIEEGKSSGNPITYEEAAHNLKDIIRYTQAATPATLIVNYLLTKNMLEDRGYKLYRVRNSWHTFTEAAPYRGVNTIFISPDGIMFELQFHTAESLVTKQIAHFYYEIMRDPRTDEEEREFYEKLSYMVFSELTEPDFIDLIH